MIYLDNAATTFPKPENVYKEINKVLRYSCGNPGRSSHRLSREAEEAVYRCRASVAELVCCEPENVVFTLNATHALNLAIKALYRGSGDVLISSVEHNAVLRPVYALGCKYRTFDVSGCDEDIISSFKRALTPKTELVICVHVSNLCGKTLPVAEIGRICAQHRIRFIIDASQSAGTLPLDIEKMSASAICAPGHKGLYGPQGSGFAVFSRSISEITDSLSPFLYGGNGVDSLSPYMPSVLPERFEAGTPATPCIAGLARGIDEVRAVGISSIHRHECQLSSLTKQLLQEIDGVKLYGAEHEGSTVLFNVEGISPETVASELDKRDISVRSGFHCCPLGHKHLMTGNNGAVRASFSMYSSIKDVKALAFAVDRIKRSNI